MRPHMIAMASWAFLIAIDVVGAIVSSVRVDVGTLWALTTVETAVVALSALLLAASTLRQDREPWHRVVRGLMLLGVWMAALYPLFLASLYVAPIGRPLADRWLSWPEVLLGVDGFTMRRWCGQHGLKSTVEFVYSCSSIPILISASAAYPERSIRAVNAFGVSSAVGVVVYLLLPAVGPGAYLHGTPSDWVGPLLAARTGQPVCLPAVGLVSCPSFHVVMATLIVLISWPSRLRIIMLVWWILLACTAMMVGEHWIIDVLAGTLLAVASWKSLRPNR